MSEPSQPDLSELQVCLCTPVPGLLLLRYRSALVLDAFLKGLRPLLGERALAEIHYDSRAAGTAAGSATALADRCRSFADATIPLIILRPKPGTVEEPDLTAVANFWKQLNAQREALGDLSAQIVLCLDAAQTPFAFSHARDLISWCSPKFESSALTSATSAGSSSPLSEHRAESSGASALLTWNSLQPLWQQVLASGLPLTVADTRRLLIPLLQSAVDLGMVTQGAHLIEQAASAPFPDDHSLVLWLLLCGELAVAQGDLAGALRYFTESKAIAERLAANDPTNAAWQRDLSVSLEKLGDLAVAQGDLTGASRSHMEAKTIRERFSAIDPANPKWQRALSVSLEKLGDLAAAKGDLAGALRYFTEAKSIAERLADSDPANAAWQRDLWISSGKLGDLEAAQGNVPEAVRHWTDSNSITKRLAASDPANAGWQRDLSVSLNKLGDLALAQGDLAGALRYFTEDKAIAEGLVASDPANAAWQRDLSVSLNKLGDLAVTQSDLAGALRYFTESKAIRERLAASDPANAEWQRDLFYSCFVIAAKVLLPQERWAEALELMEQSLRISTRLAATDRSNVTWQKDEQVSRQLVEDLRAKLAGD